MFIKIIKLLFVVDLIIFLIIKGLKYNNVYNVVVFVNSSSENKVYRINDLFLNKLKIL